jgi:hypothetical protein
MLVVMPCPQVMQGTMQFNVSEEDASMMQFNGSEQDAGWGLRSRSCGRRSDRPVFWLVG